MVVYVVQSRQKWFPSEQFLAPHGAAPWWLCAFERDFCRCDWLLCCTTQRFVADIEIAMFLISCRRVQKCEFFLGSRQWCCQRWWRFSCNIPSEDQSHSFGIHIQKDACRSWGCHRLREPTDGNKGFCVRCPWWEEFGQDTAEGSRD